MLAMVKMVKSNNNRESPGDSEEVWPVQGLSLLLDNIKPDREYFTRILSSKFSFSSMQTLNWSG